MKKTIEISKIIENIKISNDYFLIKFENKNTDNPKPGQFINIKTENTLSPLIRRPFAVFDYTKKYIFILYKVVGKTTLSMSKLKKGDEIEYFGFLGTPFISNLKNKNIWIIGGGIGIGGLHLFLKKCIAKNKVELFLGLNYKKEADDFKKLLNKLKIKIKISFMEKNNKFFKGNIVQLLKKENKKPDMIFGCGPQIMLKNLYKSIIKNKSIPSYFSMESIMACGIGTCMGCAIKIKEKDNIKFKRVCKDGPVFNADLILWT